MWLTFASNQSIFPSPGPGQTPGAGPFPGAIPGSKPGAGFPQTPPLKKGMSGCQMAMIGCAVTLVLFLILFVGVSYYVYKNARSFGANISKTFAEAAIKEAQLPEEDKSVILKHVNQLADDFRDNKLTGDQLGDIINAIMESAAIPAGMVRFFDVKYIQPSGLSPDAKVAARRTMERVARGVYEKKISHETVNHILDPAMVMGLNNKKQFKPTLTDAEIQLILDRAKAAAEEQQIPDEPFNMDMDTILTEAIAKAKAGVKDPPATGDALPSGDALPPAAPETENAGASENAGATESTPKPAPVEAH